MSFRVIFCDIPVEKFGCYFRKDLINIECNPGTRFAFKEVTYGFPAENCTETNMDVTCSRNATDCLIKNFWTFMRDHQTQKCSGRNKCEIQTTWDVKDSKCENASQNACYLIVEGNCIYEEKTIDFCEEKKIDGSKIYIHNPGFPAMDKTSSESECDCTVESDEALRLEALIFTLDFQLTNCSSSLSVYNENNSLIFPCDLRMYQQSLNITDSHRINLKLITDKSWNAYQIWLKVNSVNNEKVTVTCKKTKGYKTSPIERSTTPSKENILIVEKEKIEDLMIGVKIAAGIIGGLILVALIMVTVFTYRRYTNIGVRIKPSTLNRVN